jgi:hypothetical protein
MHPGSSVRFQLLALALFLPSSRPLYGQVVNHLYDKLEIGVQASDVIVISDIRVDAEYGPDGTDFELGDLRISKSEVRAGRERACGRGGDMKSPLALSRSGGAGKGPVDTIIADTLWPPQGQYETASPEPADELLGCLLHRPRQGGSSRIGAMFFSLDGGRRDDRRHPIRSCNGAGMSVIGPTAASTVCHVVWGSLVLQCQRGVGARISNIGVGSWRGLPKRSTSSPITGQHLAAGPSPATGPADDEPGWLTSRQPYGFQTIRLGMIYALHQPTPGDLHPKEPTPRRPESPLRNRRQVLQFRTLHQDRIERRLVLAPLAFV